MSGARRTRQLGVTLVEQIVFIAVVGVAVAGVMAAFVMSTRGSADPMLQKQALAIAEAILEEVQLMPYTYCDPDDPQAATAQNAGVGATGCSAGGPETSGPESAAPFGPESRTSTTMPFDNVNDYHGYATGAGISNINGDAVAGLGAYAASVSVAGQALGAIAAADSLLVTVTVTGPAGTTVRLQGYRTRYAPNALPWIDRSAGDGTARDEAARRA
jgi:MSHA pilin protein MshD